MQKHNLNIYLFDSQFKNDLFTIEIEKPKKKKKIEFTDIDARLILKTKVSKDPFIEVCSIDKLSGCDTFKKFK